MNDHDDLRGRLATLAERAPAQLPANDLWARGRCRQRRLQAGTALLAVAVLIAGVAGIGFFRGAGQTPAPADVPFGRLHIPVTVHPPNPWSEGTAQAGPPGRLAVLSIGNRLRREGLTGKQSSPALFGVSAVDGRPRFVDLAGLGREGLSTGCVVLSPDGTKVGYCRWRGTKLRGWAVYDTVSGRTTMLADPGNPEIVGSDFSELAFSGDSRYLETNYSRSGSKDSRAHDFVVWNVATGRPTTVEKAGHYYFPEIGAGPTGIVWSRGRTINRTDPGSNTTRSTFDAAPYDIIAASYGPGGKLAMITFGPTKKAEWRVYVEGRRVAGIKNIMSILGWRDADHVIVVSTPYTNTASYIDVRTGKVTQRVHLRANALMTPSYASDLWANSLVPGRVAPHVADPRLDILWGGLCVGAVMVTGLGLLILRRRRD